MNIPSIKDLVKDNNVIIQRFKSGNLFYRLIYSTGLDDEEVKYCYEFPVPIEDVGEAEMKNQDKAIYFMRYIKRAITDNTFLLIWTL